MPRFHKLSLLLFLLLESIVSMSRPCCAAQFCDSPIYNLDSLCYISTDVVEASLVRHQNTRNIVDDTFTATVLSTLGGDYKPGDKIELPYNQVSLPPQHSCSLCILFVARKDFQLDIQSAKATLPQVNEVLPVDEFGRVQRYFQWSSQISKISPKAEDTAELNHPEMANECRIIASRWTAVNPMRPLLSHALRQEDVPHLLSVNRQRLRFCKASLVLEDVIDVVIHARLMDLHNPASQQSEKLASNIRFIGVLQHIICGH